MWRACERGKPWWRRKAAAALKRRGAKKGMTKGGGRNRWALRGGAQAQACAAQGYRGKANKREKQRKGTGGVGARACVPHSALSPHSQTPSLKKKSIGGRVRNKNGRWEEEEEEGCPFETMKKETTRVVAPGEAERRSMDTRNHHTVITHFCREGGGGESRSAAAPLHRGWPPAAAATSNNPPPPPPAPTRQRATDPPTWPAPGRS